MARNQFVTAVNCMDGRVQEPVIRWMTRRLAADYVDMITEPGPVGLLAAGQATATESIHNRVQTSVDAHGSQTIAVIGHGDCAGNPIDEDTHQQQVRQAAAIVQCWYPALRTLALWVNRRWMVEVLEDSAGSFA